jgi:homoserine O-acetyltransferase
VKSLVTIAGGSMGGMQVLEWAVMYPEMVRSIMPIATAGRHSAWCVALHEAQRQAILLDPDFKGGDYEKQPARGLGIARTVAMISYRATLNTPPASSATGSVRTPTSTRRTCSRWRVTSGTRARSWWSASTPHLPLHHVGDGSTRHLPRAAARTRRCCARSRSPALCAGITSDMLYPVHEQKEIARHIPRARYFEIDSIHGHDAFLIEWDQVTRAIHDFLVEVAT